MTWRPLAERGDVQATDEQREVFVRRFKEARAAGLTLVEARLFAESDCDIGLLRKLVEFGCPPAQIAKVLI